MALLACVALFALLGCTKAENPHKTIADINGADTAWLLVSTALVMLMTPALAFFYGGLVRNKNVLSVVMQSFIALGVITIIWVLFGYSLAFGPSLIKVGESSFLGSLNWAGARNVGLAPHTVYANTVPHRLFMMYQCMFAVITPALISGAFAERMKFKTYLAFISLWCILVYCPVAHWVWSENGWLLKLGALDFAGGTVVHISSGYTALLVAIMIKPRRGFPREAFVPHNLITTVLGAGLLWFGWFGFNAGSALSSGSVAVVAFTSTHIAAAAGAVAWMFVDWFFKDKPTILGAASGAVAGLVAITPAAGYVGPLAAIVIGGIAGVVCSYAVTLRARKGIDDALDAFGVHGVGGTIGAILTGVFASSYLNSAVTKPSLLGGGVALMGAQILAVVATIAYAVIVSYIILKVLDLTMGLRVSTEEEQMGLDIIEHGEAAYTS
ncbi:MAG: ammonium transporter [Candidatus Sumerlaeaceae bacterium]|nr:ammonium transporter [Candidatus Sumerlaeaceae bacterium]